MPSNRKLLVASRAIMPMLIIQMITGMYVNLFVQPPARKTAVSPLVQLFTASSPVLPLHVVVGTVVLILSAAITLTVFWMRRASWYVLSTAGLISVLTAFMSGVLFVQGGYVDNTLSFAMAMGFVAALAIYGAIAQVVNASELVRRQSGGGGESKEADS